MKPPICRLCRQAHWPRDPHIWPGEAEPFTIKPSVIQETAERGAEMRNHLSEVFQAEPDPPRNSAPSPSPRKPHNPIELDQDDPPQAPSPALDTTDTEPSQKPKFDKRAYQAVLMRRRRDLTRKRPYRPRAQQKETP